MSKQNRIDRYGLQRSILKIPRKAFSPPQRMVLYLFTMHANSETGFVWTSMDTLSDNSGFSRSTIARAVKALCADGIVRKRFFREKSQTWVYQINYARLHEITRVCQSEGGVSERPMSESATPVTVHGGCVTVPTYLSQSDTQLSNDKDMIKSQSFEDDDLEYIEWWNLFEGWSRYDQEARQQVIQSMPERCRRAIQKYGGYQRVYDDLNTTNEFSQAKMRRVLNKLLKKVA